MTPRRKLFYAGTAVLLVAVHCDTVYDVTLHLSDGALTRGFGCTVKDDAGNLVTLVQERIDNKTSLAVVLDVIDMGREVISCRSASFADYCSKNPCAVSQRACYTISGGDAGLSNALQQAYAQLKAQDAGISGIRTDETVMVRFVVTAQNMANACDPSVVLDYTQVTGCVYSCPTRLNASGSLDLDLDVPTFISCELAVEACAIFPKSLADAL